MTDDKSTMSSTEEDLENIGIFRIDPSLKPYKDHFKYRLKRYVDQRKLIEEYEGGLRNLLKFMNAFDRAMNLLDDNFSFLASTKQIVSSADDDDKVVFERVDPIFVFNFHPENTYEGYKVGCDLPGKYRVALDSDAWEFGGHGRVGHNVDHFTSPEGLPGVPETNFNNRPNSFKVFSPARTCVAYYRVEESQEEDGNSSLVGLEETSTAADVRIPDESASVESEDSNLDGAKETLAAADVAIMPDESAPIESEDSNWMG